MPGLEGLREEKVKLRPERGMGISQVTQRAAWSGDGEVLETKWAAHTKARTVRELGALWGTESSSLQRE